jgi:pyruvate/2-oxoglutarate dehydrogenase complex dihydrolipoamide acyltransferase (E2) component
VAAGDALLVPVVRDADTETFRQVASRDPMDRRCSRWAIRPPQLSDGTFTVSNLVISGIASFKAGNEYVASVHACVGPRRLHPTTRVVYGHRRATRNPMERG